MLILQVFYKIHYNYNAFQLPAVVLASPECLGNSIELGSRAEVYLPYGPSSITGHVVACIDSEYVDVCATTDEIQYFADQACNSLGSSYSKLLIR